MSRWTLKEAYSKTTGISLLEALRQLRIIWHKDGRATISGYSPDSSWTFSLFKLEEQILALCWQNGLSDLPDFYHLPTLDSKPVKLKPEQILLIRQ